MSSTLVTGASGFLGSAVISRLLRAEREVVGLDPVPSPRATWCHVVDDLSDRHRLIDLLRKKAVTHVIHCGGVSGPMVLADDPAAVIDINVTGSINLLQAALECAAKTFLHCSSVSAVGNFYEMAEIDVNYPLRPTNTYGCSKAAMDMVLRGLWKRVPIDLCVLRFTSIYGPGRRTSLIVDEIVAASRRGASVTVEPTTDWPYIYIDDAADAVVAACFSDRRQQLFYFITYPEQVSLQQLAAAAVESGGLPIQIVVDDRRAKVARGPLDISAAQRDFGFAPKVDYRLGIRCMIEAQRNTPAGGDGVVG